MASSVDYFLEKTLGGDFMESLSKVELWKPGTKSTLDHEEIRTALQIVPRTVMALLIRELSPMILGETKEIILPVNQPAAKMRATKHERDVYSGEIEQDNKKIAEFKFRSLPGVGLIIMTAFELYDMDNLINSQNQDEKVNVPDASEKVQKLIDERLALHDLIGKVVDKKIMEKEAIHRLVLSKLTEAMSLQSKIAEAALRVAPKSENCPIVAVLEEKKRKVSPVKEFLEKRKSKKEFSIQLAKGELVDCPDCRKNIFDGKIFSGCICLGDDMEKKVFIKKNEDGIKVRFGKGWDQENIEMLLEVLRRKHG